MKTQNSKLKTQKYPFGMLRILSASKDRSKVKNIVSIANFAFFIAILHFALYTLHLSEAHAEGVSLKVAPSLLQIKLHPPTQINAPVAIENASDEAITLKPELRLFKASPKANGQIEYIPNSGPKADFLKNIRLMDGEAAVSELTLAAKQKRELQLNIQAPADTPSQDVYLSVVFLNTQASDTDPSESEKTSTTILNAGIAMNVILSVGDSQSSAAIETFRAPGFVQKGPIPFTVKIQNNGSEYIRPKGNITIKNMFGQTIGKMDLDPETILAGSSRYLSDSKGKLTPTPYTLNPKALWEESFLLGFYEAKLTVHPAPDAIPLTQTLRFTALPIRLVAGFILAILLGVTIYHRVKEKMIEK